jgi:hypothetical protein
MAYGQIDPARLEGDDLTRWYLRSPAEIERARQIAAAQRYDDFFGSPDSRQPSLNEDTSAGLALASETQFAPAKQLAAAPWFCKSCHAGSPPAAISEARPPPPFVPPHATRWSPGPTLAPRRPAKPHPPQCAMQNMRDSRICAQEPGDALKSVCLESAAEREAHCIASDGEINWPPLQTHTRW